MSLTVGLIILAIAIGAAWFALWTRRRRDKQAVEDTLGFAPATDHRPNVLANWLQAMRVRRSTGRRSDDDPSALAVTLERARIPLRPTEAVVGASMLTALALVLTLAMTRSLMLTGFVAVGVPVALINWVKHKIAARRRSLKEQMPEALAMLSSSMRSGHTLHRSMESLATSGPVPLSEEFSQVLAETNLGVSVVEAVHHMAARIDLPEAVWLARAMAIHYSVGGRLADLLQTLADLTYSRHELEREIQALTAEGRMSAWMLGLLPVALIVAIELTNPSYLNSLYSGWGLVALVGCGLSVVVGSMIIRRMVQIRL